MKSKVCPIISLIILLIFSNLFAARKGSETAVTIEPLAIFHAGDDDNKMLAFGWFKNGFVLEDSTTSCTFASVFPVSGSVVLNGGTLYLDSDIHLANITTMTSLGIVDAQNHIIEIDSSVERLFNTDQDITLKNADLFLHSDLNIDTTVNFYGDCYVNGRNRSFVLGDGIEIIVAPNSTLIIKNISLKNLGRNSLRCFDDTGKIILDNVKIYFDENFSFTVGKVVVKNMVDFCGTHTFFYDCNHTITVNFDSTVKFSDGVNFAIGKNQNLVKDRIFYFQDSSSKLWLENANLYVGPGGIQPLRGSIVLSGKVDIDIASTDITNGIILGDGTSEGDVTGEFYPASYVNFKNGHLVYNEFDPNKFVSQSPYSKVIRGPANTFHIEKSQNFSNITIKIDPSSVLTVADGQEVSYQDCKIVMPGVKFTITGGRYNTYTSKLSGNEELFMEEGTLGLYFLILNNGNLISGNGNLSGVITLYDNDAKVIFNLDGQLLNHVVLNCGELILNKDLEFAHSASLLTTGTVALFSKNLRMGSDDLIWTSTIYFDGQHGSFDLNSKVNLSSSWTFSDDCVLNGNNNILELGSSGQILVEKGSTLIIKNTKFSGLSGNKIRCLGNDSKIIFDNVVCTQDGDFTISIGQLEFFNQNVLKGAYNFFYEIDKTFTIHSNSELRLTDGLTFGFGALGGVVTRKSMWLQDFTSVMNIDSANIICGSQGVELTRGLIIFNGKVEMDIQSTSLQNGVWLGDGTAEGDIHIKFNTASYTHFKNGHIVCNLVNTDNFDAVSKSAVVDRSGTNHLHLKQSMVFNNVSFKTALTTIFTVENNAQSEMVDCESDLGIVKYGITGSRYDDYTFLLDGNEELFIQEGTMPLYFLVMSTNNTIKGNGNLSGGVILADSDAIITFDLDGYLLNNITLNGGKVCLDGNLNFGHDKSFIGAGTVDLSNQSLKLGPQSLSWTSTIYWDGDYGTIELNSYVGLYSTWTFSRNCIINGNGNILIVQPGAQINVERGSSLTFRNIRLGGLSGTNICCLDNAGTIYFDGGKSKLFGDYSFEKGKFYVSDDWEIRGHYIFSYKSGQQSTIGQCTILSLFPGLTFSYCPETDSRNLLKMNCESVLLLDDATLHSTTTGLQLTGGTLRISGDCILISDATCRAEGVIIGDGITSANDTQIDVLPESDLQVTSGYLIYKNLD